MTTMELSSINHIDPDYLNHCTTDLFITSLSHESRCTNIARMLETVRCRKVALAGKGQVKEHAYKENLEYFMEKGFEILPVESDVPDMGGLLKGYVQEKIHLFFDYTNMPQHWYYEILKWFGENQNGFKTATLRFAYTMGGFVNEGPSLKVKKVHQVIRNGQRGKNKKQALILGLGHEASVSESIYKMIKPDLLYLYYADPPVDKRFVEKLFVNNHALINLTPIRNLIAYPILNGQVIYQSLIDTILPLRNEHVITLIPQGPKVFSLASMLVHLGYPDTNISYPTFKRIQVTDRHPIGEPIILDVHFEEEE